MYNAYLIDGKHGVFEENVLLSSDVFEKVFGNLLSAALDAVLLGTGVVRHQQVHHSSGSCNTENIRRGFRE